MVLLNEMHKELPFGRPRLVYPVAGRLLLKRRVQVNVLHRPVLNLPPWIHKESWMVIRAVIRRQVPPSKIAYGAICRLLAALACVGVFGNLLEVVHHMHLSR
jgi:hypothetical protein